MQEGLDGTIQWYLAHPDDYKTWPAAGGHLDRLMESSMRPRSRQHQRPAAAGKRELRSTGGSEEASLKRARDNGR